MHSVVWFNGNFIQRDDAKVNVMTHTLHYGSGVFEGIRAYNWVPFKLCEHITRLHHSAKSIGFEIPYTVEELSSATTELLKRNNLSEAYIRPVAFNASVTGGLETSNNDISVAIIAWEWNLATKTTGIKVKFSDFIRPMPAAAIPHAKINGQYFMSCLCKNKAIKDGYNDAIFLDWRGFVAEFTGANIFIVKDGSLITPVADCFLNGITRQTVIEIASANGINVYERHVTKEELIDADEIFACGTAAEILPITQIESQGFKIGPVTEKLRKLYMDIVWQKNVV